MKSKKKDTIKKRVTSRLKGLGAIMLALFMILTGMSLMPPVEAEAATGDQYWIIGYTCYRDLLFCTGQESIDESGKVYEVLNSSNDWNNGYVTYDENEYVILSDGSPFTSSETLSSSGWEITISPEEDTYVNAGCVHSYELSGMLFQMKVDGTVKAETTGLGEEGKAGFLLDAGTYAVKCSTEPLEGNGIRYKFIVDFESVIDSLTVTPPDATLTFGGSTQTLTVSPANAADKVEWSSEDTKIATVDSDGTVTPVSAGTVTIKATYTPEEGDPIVGTCKVTVNKAESTVTKEPTANDLTYNGQAQELVTAGEATGGEMQYALGTDEKTEPTTGWSDKVPSNTDAGTYYVWYKVVGDVNHNDVDAECIEVTIEEEPAKEEPAKEEPKEEPAKEEPKEEPAKEEPAKEEPKEEPAKEEPKPEEPVILKPEDLDEGELVADNDGLHFYIQDNGDVTCYTANDKEVYRGFACDGTDTYFFQYDGTAMRDRLTYHPDGEHIIYFDEEGHEIFNDYAHVKHSIEGEEVDDYCFFDVYGHMYVDVLTWDQTGTKLLYANPYGVLEVGKWFQFSDTVVWADGTPVDEGMAGGYGYAMEDATLMRDQYTYDWEGRLCYMQGNGVALY